MSTDIIPTLLYISVADLVQYLKEAQNRNMTVGLWFPLDLVKSMGDVINKFLSPVDQIPTGSKDVSELKEILKGMNIEAVIGNEGLKTCYHIVLVDHQEPRYTRIMYGALSTFSDPSKHYHVYGTTKQFEAIHRLDRMDANEALPERWFHIHTPEHSMMDVNCLDLVKRAAPSTG